MKGFKKGKKFIPTGNRSKINIGDNPEGDELHNKFIDPKSGDGHRGLIVAWNKKRTEAIIEAKTTSATGGQVKAGKLFHVKEKKPDQYPEVVKEVKSIPEGFEASTSRAKQSLDKSKLSEKQKKDIREWIKENENWTTIDDLPNELFGDLVDSAGDDIDKRVAIQGEAIEYMKSIKPDHAGLDMSKEFEMNFTKKEVDELLSQIQYEKDMFEADKKSGDADKDDFRTDELEQYKDIIPKLMNFKKGGKLPMFDRYELGTINRIAYVELLMQNAQQDRERNYHIINSIEDKTDKNR